MRRRAAPVVRRAPPAARRNRRPRDRSCGSAAWRTPAGTPWPGPSRHTRRIPPACTNRSTARVLHRGLQILADGQEIDVGDPQIVHDLHDFRLRLAQADHQAGFGEDRRVDLLHPVEQAQRLVIARAGPDRRIQPRHGLQVVVEHVRPRRRRRVSRRPACAGSRGSGPRSWCPARPARIACDDGGEMRRPAVGQIVAVDRGDHHVAQAQFRHRIGDARRLVGFQAPAAGRCARCRSCRRGCRCRP